MNPSRPYLIRALHEWLLDNDVTPYLVVDARVKGVMVPEQFVTDGQIVLNISPGAVQGLLIDDEAISFSARFGGVSMNLYVPMAAVLAVYAKENGEGMGFGMEPGAEVYRMVQDDPEPPEPEPPSGGSALPSEGSSARPALKVVK